MSKRRKSPVFAFNMENTIKHSLTDQVEWTMVSVCHYLDRRSYLQGQGHNARIMKISVSGITSHCHVGFGYNMKRDSYSDKFCAWPNCLSWPAISGRPRSHFTYIRPCPDHNSVLSCWIWIISLKDGLTDGRTDGHGYSNTVKPVFNGHWKDWRKVSFIDRWQLNSGSFMHTWKMLIWNYAKCLLYTDCPLKQNRESTKGYSRWKVE